MDFGTIPFMIWFLPVFLCIYVIVRPYYGKKTVLILGSIFFYGISYIKWLPLLLILTLLAIWGAFCVRKWGKPQLVIWVSVFVGILVLNKLSKHLMPGISFFVFTALSLLFDCYRKQVSGKGVLDMMSYLLFFPKLLSGPIARMSDMETRTIQLLGEKQSTVLANLESGIVCFIIGLGYKILLANQLGGLWYQVQTIGFASVSTQLAWLGIIGYSLQLYFDFQGYSLMAIGIAKMLGYTLPENFDSPYLSKSVSEFYRRWHMTLGSWFRDYIYIPLGGSKKGLKRTLCNLAVVWVLTALWHGMHWNFVLWGMFLLFWIMLEKIGLRKILEGIPLLGHAYVLVLIPFSWVFFSLHNMSDIVQCFLRLFGQAGVQVAAGDYIKYGSMYAPFLIAGIFFAFPYGERWLRTNCKKGICVLLLLVIFWLAVYESAMSAQNPFMYFRF